MGRASVCVGENTRSTGHTHKHCHSCETFVKHETNGVPYDLNARGKYRSGIKVTNSGNVHVHIPRYHRCKVNKYFNKRQSTIPQRKNGHKLGKGEQMRDISEQVLYHYYENLFDDMDDEPEEYVHSGVEESHHSIFHTNTLEASSIDTKASCPPVFKEENGMLPFKEEHHIDKAHGRTTRNCHLCKRGLHMAFTCSILEDNANNISNFNGKGLRAQYWRDHRLCQKSHTGKNVYFVQQGHNKNKWCKNDRKAGKHIDESWRKGGKKGLPYAEHISEGYDEYLHDFVDTDVNHELFGHGFTDPAYWLHECRWGRDGYEGEIEEEELEEEVFEDEVDPEETSVVEESDEEEWEVIQSDSIPPPATNSNCLIS